MDILKTRFDVGTWRDARTKRRNKELELLAERDYIRFSGFHFFFLRVYNKYM